MLELVQVDGEKEVREFPNTDINRAQLEAFADAIEGEAPFPGDQWGRGVRGGHTRIRTP